MDLMATPVNRSYLIVLRSFYIRVMLFVQMDDLNSRTKEIVGELNGSSG